ncbi:unnamed protein product [Penicillium salamii]|nr:unnamed protein product [Penicillium salamii]
MIGRPVEYMGLFPVPNRKNESSSDSHLVTTRPSVIDTIQSKASEQPESTAICASDGELTYAQLESAGTRLALHLRDLGVCEDVMVPLLFHRCQWVIVAQLAVLKAGGAFVPLDPLLPDARMTNIIGRIKCSLILTSEDFVDRGSALVEKPVCVGPHLMSDLLSDDMNNGPLLPQPNPTAPAYVLFTSGSTGESKGCVIPYQAMAQISNQITTKPIDISSSSRVLQFASYGFAMSIVEIYYGLCAGATICIPSDHDRMNNLTCSMEEMSVTWSIMTPSLLRTLNPDQKPSSLKTVLVAGEAVVKEEIDRWAVVLDLMQVYGASEGCGLIGFTDPKVDFMAFHPVPGLHLWVADADDHYKLAPSGDVGELMVEGQSLAQGYLNDLLTTSASFVDPPVWWQSMSLPGVAPRYLYKTGDFFRQDQDDSFFFIGRKALDVKIRGKRVDLREIEYHVRQCCLDVTQAIAEAAPLADGSQAPVLVVFLQSPRYLHERKQAEDEGSFVPPCETFQSDVQTIQTRLLEFVPDHMIPTFYVPLWSVPMTVTEKIDRRELRKLLHKHTVSDLQTYQAFPAVEMVGPTSEAEKCLHDVFAHVLGLDSSRFGVHHSFIRLGGDSMSAMKVVASCRSKNYHSITVAEILALGAISKLAQHLERSTSVESLSIITPEPFSLVPGADQNDNYNLLSSTAEVCGVPVDSIQDIYPCTALQEGLMITTIKSRDMYVARLFFDLTSGMDIEKFQHAWQQAVDANVILRTRIVQSLSGGMMQAVLCEESSTIKWHSYPSFEAYHNEDKALAMGPGIPLIRFNLIGNPSSDLSLALTMHHAIFDRYSLKLVLTQVQEAYSGQTLESNIFSPFIQTIQRQDPVTEKEFWRETFAGFEAPVFPSIPHDAVAPAATSHLEHIVNLPGQTASGITMSNLVRMAWAIVVSTYTDCADVAFGVTVNGRAAPTPGIETLTAPTIATVPFRVRCNRADTVLDALADIQSLAIRMIGFEQSGLQNIRQISPETASACDFQSQLIFQEADTIHDKNSMIMKGKTAEYGLDDLSLFINYAVGLICTPSAGGQSIRIDTYFDPRILPENTAHRLVNQFTNILQQIWANPSKRMDQLDLVNSREVELMDQWNANVLSAEYPHTLHELILQRAKDQLQAPAVSSWDQSLTYQDLKKLSETVGQQIIESGVQPGDRVALCFEKSIWSVVSMLSVLRAGAAGVNIDPTLPPARVQAMLQVVEPSLVLTCPETTSAIQSLESRLSVLELPSTTASKKEYTGVAKWPYVKPDDVAFILFTSGTTGTPKGIVLEHRHFAAAFHIHREPLGGSPGMRSLHFCSYAWDMSLQEVFFTWVHGGCLCIPSETQRMSNLAGFIRDHRVNWAVMTPSATTILTPDEVPGLEILFLTGENVPIDLMEKWSSRVRLINAYGPAEAFTSASGQINPDLHSLGRVGSFIGTAGWITIPGNVNRLAPLGTIGELLLEGPMVSSGYFKEPEKTREAFIEAPAWLRRIRPDGYTGRIHRTGDLGRVDNEGVLHYVGRMDTQVKLRGQRVVLGDIEHQVQLHFASAQQVIADVIRPEGSTSGLLLAFIYQGPTGREDNIQLLQDPTETFLQQSASAIVSLQEILPAHMIPTAMLPIHHVPYGKTLKIDRRKLKDHAQQLTPDQLQRYAVGLEGSDSFKEPPNTSSEVTWQGLWAQVLSIPAGRIGRNDHLFRMGGDSLLAIKLVALAHREGLWQINFQDVFNNPRLKDIAAVSSSFSPIVDAPQEYSPPEPFCLIEDVKTLAQMASEQCGITVNNIEDIYPCAPLQSEMIASTVHHSDAYIMLQSYSLTEGVDIVRLKNSWESVAEAHPILRTRIIQTSAGASYQVVVKEPLRWSSLETDDCKPPHPSVGLGTPLIQLLLSPSRLLLSIHHALYDGWTLSLLTSEVNKKYNNVPIESSALFNRFIAHIESSMSPAASYWKKELQDVEPIHFPALPTLNYRPKAGSSIEKVITLHESTVSENATLASKIKLAWALLTRAYTNSDDVVVGVVSSGRSVPVPGIEKILGPTIATVPMRFRLDPRQLVVEALEKTQGKFTEQAPYEHFGLRKISQQCENAAAACQFQTVIIMESKHNNERSLQKGQPWYLRQEVLSNASQFSSHALSLLCQPLPEESTVKVTAVFDPDVLPLAQMQRALTQFEHFLNQLQSVADPSITAIGDLQAVSPQDVKEIMSWNPLPSHTDGDFGPCVYELLREKYQSQPDKQAIHAWDGNFTYKELDNHVALLASRIQNFGTVHPDTFVALYFEKSKWTVVAQLAVLKAGGAFVMFNPAHPTARLKEIFSMVQPPLILAAEDRERYVAGKFSVPVVGVGHDTLKEQPLCLDCKGSGVKPSNAMYAVATSGTTGKPKVIVIEHRNFIANITPMMEMVGLSSDARVFQFTSYSFDAAILDHLGALFAGGCLCVPSQFDCDNFVEKAITNMSANWVTLTKSMIQSLSPATIPTIKTMIQTGEPLNQGVIDRWASHVRLINGYGPSECTIATCSNKNIRSDSDPLDIGRPMHSAAWIVDPDTLKLAAIGAVGELVIESGAVGRGYLNDPERTAGAFIPRPKWLNELRGHVIDEAVYRTGDLVKYTPNGSIRYVRRKDLQIKLRGQRLELSEVEHHVERCFPGALNVVATVIKLIKSSASLVALVLSSSDLVQSPANTDILLPATSSSKFLEDAQVAELALQGRVPPYMVPSIFLPLSRLPRNNNGKIDRNQINARLAALTRQEVDSYSNLSTTQAPAPPENYLQIQIRGIWATVLDTDPTYIGIRSSFFRIGGDSVTAMQVISQCRAAGKLIAMQDLFKHRTIERLAAHITRSNLENAEVPRPEQLEIFDREVDLSPMQQMFFEHAIGNPNLLVPSLMLRLTKTDFDAAEINRAFDIVVKTHSMLRARFKKSSGGKWTQSISSNTESENYRYYVSGVQTQEGMKSICRSRQQELDIQRGPLLIVDQFERDDGANWLNFMAHHLIVDLISWRVILSDLELILTNGQVPAPSFPFLHWCQIQADYAVQNLPAVPAESKPNIAEYWGREVINRNNQCNVDTYTISVDQETSQILLGSANDPLSTQPVEIIQAAALHSFVQLFPDREAPVIFSKGHGREPWDPAIDITRTVGWFTTLWPTPVTLEASEGVLAALRRTKDSRRSTPANGWEYFTSRYLHPRSSGSKGAMEIIFNYHGGYQQWEREDALLKFDGTNRFGDGYEVEDMSRFSLLDISAQVTDECLQLQFIVNRYMKHQDRLQQWPMQCVQSLRDACIQLSSMQGKHHTLRHS